jgi:DUF2934 family protein
MEYDSANAEHDEIERLAYQFWEERGRPFGSPDVDWLRAQEDLARNLDLSEQLPFSSMMTEPIEV